MSDITSTVKQFEMITNELGVKPHPYISMILEREGENELIQTKTDMNLYLAGNHKLLSATRFTDDDCKILERLGKINSFITSIDLRYNNIGDDGATLLASMLKMNDALVSLNLMCNYIGPLGGEALAKALLSNTTLQRLYLNGNKMANKGALCFAQSLLVNKTLLHLDLGEIDLTLDGIIALASVLQQNSSLKSINVSRPILSSIQEEATVHVSDMLKLNKRLEEIHLQKFGMTDYGVFHFAETVSYNSTLTHLDISCNRISQDGAKELSIVLKKNSVLQTLDLGYNRIENNGAKYIADALAMFNRSLKCLVIVSNNIGSTGLCAIADAMKINTTLTSVFIWGNHLEEPTCIAFDNLITSERLKLCNTDVRPYHVDGVTYLAELNHHINRHYYYGPIYGDDVPPWQERGINPRSKEKDGSHLPIYTPMHIWLY